MEESWKQVPEAYKYAVSNLGRVKNLQTGRILKVQMIAKTPTVTMMDAGYRLCRSIPKLVSEVFGGG